MQPIVLKIVNAAGFGVLQRTNTWLLAKRKLRNLDILGNSTEPLLSTAIKKLQEQVKCWNKVQTKTSTILVTQIIEWYTKPNVFRKAPEGILKAWNKSTETVT
jgi:hypothetical protein